MIFLQFIIFVIPLIFGSLCEAGMENDMKILLARMEQRLNQQIHMLQQKHEDSLSHLQTHITNLEKENSAKDQRFNQLNQEIHTLHQKYGNSISHLQADISNIEKENVVKDQRFLQEIHTLQQKHENTLGHLQTHILNLEKENQLLQSKVKQNAEKLMEFRNENQNLKLHLENENKKIIDIENKLSIFENTFLYKNAEYVIDDKIQENKDILPVHQVNQENEGNIAKYPNSESDYNYSPLNHKFSIQNVSKENMNEIQSHQINSLEKMITDLQDEDVSLKQQIGEIKQQQMEEKQKVSVISEQLNTTLNQRSTFVSFTAYATEYRDYNADDIVLFDGIVYNYGGHYNQTNSIFTCPYSGFYLFSVNVLAVSTDRMAVGLRIDGVHVIGAYARDIDTEGHASLTTVQLCQQGASVWVRNKDDGNVMNGNGNRFSSFTGTLLRIV